MTTLSTRTDEILALAEKATPAKWSAVPQNDGSSMIAREYETGKQMNPKGLRLIAHVMARGSSLSEDEANAAFIARAHDMALLISDYRDALAAAEKDAARYRWLRDRRCNSLSVERDEHAANYVTAKQWIEEYAADSFDGVPDDVLQAMKDANTIWRLQIYPNTPVGFNVYFGATMDTAIDTAIASEQEQT